MPNHDSVIIEVASGAPDAVIRREAALLKTGALQDAIFNSANFSSIATDEKGVIQLFNVGAERMLGYAAIEVVDKITPADISDPQEVIARAKALSIELATPITPGFEALVFKASRGIEDIYELTYIRKDGSRFPAVVSVTALRDAQGAIIGYLLIGTDNTAKDFVSKPFDMAELKARVHNILEVRLLHLKTKSYSEALEATVKELEASREVIRAKNLEEQKKREQELVLAQQTQESLLPRNMPKFDNFCIHAFNNPTRYVGGDFYDFQQLSSGEWMGVLADVSGKGMAAALLSSMVLGALSTEFRSGTAAQDVLNRVNRLLCEKSLPDQFVTLFVFVLNPAGQGHFISAGHNIAYLYRAASGKIETLVPDSYFMGMFDFASYESRPLYLGAGDILVVYSDGLTDAETPQGEMFGEQRLLEVIRQAAPAGSRAVQRSFLKAIGDFTQGMPQTDDITFVIVEKSGAVHGELCEVS